MDRLVIQLTYSGIFWLVELFLNLFIGVKLHHQNSIRPNFPYYMIFYLKKQELQK